MFMAGKYLGNRQDMIKYTQQSHIETGGINLTVVFVELPKPVKAIRDETHDVIYINLSYAFRGCEVNQ
jgi:hypothetical protein